MAEYGTFDLIFTIFSWFSLFVAALALLGFYLATYKKSKAAKELLIKRDKRIADDRELGEIYSYKKNSLLSTPVKFSMRFVDRIHTFPNMLFFLEPEPKKLATIKRAHARQ